MASDIVDGILKFKVRDRAGEVTEREIDILLLRLHCEECEEVHNLQVDKEDRIKPTAAFLADLAGRLSAAIGGNCTPTIAYHLWCASQAEIEALKKNMSETPSSPTGSESSPEP